MPRLDSAWLDWRPLDRQLDDEGNQRELHNDIAIDAIDFNMKDNFRVNYEKDPNASNLMVDCPYFHTSFLHVTTPVEKVNTKDSFFIYMCVEGQAIIEADGSSTTLGFGETILIPAAVKSYKITSNNAKLLEVYV